MFTTFRLSLFALILALPSTSLAQLGEDVCCIWGKQQGEGAETRSGIVSEEDCRPGQVVNGFKVCLSKPDPSNLCPTLAQEEMCKACGFHWISQACLSVDPVEKAKKELKEQKAKEDAQKTDQ